MLNKMLGPKTKQGWAQGPTQSKERPKGQTKYEMGLSPKTEQGQTHSKKRRHETRPS